MIVFRSCTTTDSQAVRVRQNQPSWLRSSPQEMFSSLCTYRVHCCLCLFMLLAKCMHPDQGSSLCELVCIEIAVLPYSNMASGVKAGQAIVPDVVQQEYG